MFTGLVQQLGTVREVLPGPTVRLVIACDRAWDEPYEHGESIATSGVCLTVVDSGDEWFAVDVMAQTLALTSLAEVGAGSRVNLERAMRLGDRLGGHMVQGHVDGVATVTIGPARSTGKSSASSCPRTCASTWWRRARSAWTGCR